MATVAETTAENTRKERDNPAHAVLRHLAAGSNAEAVKTAIREVTIERLESNGAVAGLAALRAELFSGGGAASRAEPAGGAARGGSRGSRAVQQELPLGKPKDDEGEDEDVEEEEVEDEEEEETPAPDEEDERTPLRRPVSRAGRGAGARKGRRGK